MISFGLTQDFWSLTTVAIIDRLRAGTHPWLSSCFIFFEREVRAPVPSLAANRAFGELHLLRPSHFPVLLIRSVSGTLASILRDMKAYCWPIDSSSHWTTCYTKTTLNPVALPRCLSPKGLCPFHDRPIRRHKLTPIGSKPDPSIQFACHGIPTTTCRRPV